MASNPPGSCCYKGVKHEGTAVGEYIQIDNFEAYVTYPESKSTEYAILLITDVIGHRFNNAQLIADQFAANGYFVLVPDLFDMNPIPLNRPDDFDIMGWLDGKYHPKGRKNMPATVDPIIEASIKELRTKYKAKKIGAAGYCFGGKYVVRFLQPGGKIDVGYTAHPSFVDSDELNAIKGPLAISAADTDVIFPSDKRYESEAILKELKLPYQINLYSGVEHGFAIRADLKDRVSVYAMENAFLQAIQWFEEHLKE